MMKEGKGQLLAAMLLIPGLMTLASPKVPNLEALLEQSRSDDYAVPSTRSILQAQESFRHWLAAADRLEAIRHLESPDSRDPGFKDPGFKDLGFVPVGQSRPEIVVLTETADGRRGQGLFAARLQGGAPLLIQAPHQFHDRHTGTIARQLFLESSAMAAAWNTTHRNNSDLVHIPDSYLHALSRAFADLHSEGRILQLHGFSRAKRKSQAGREAEAILSDGSRQPPRALARLADCLSQRLGIRVQLYPRDVRELGATTNTLATDLRHRGFGGFVHLELDAELRQRLVRDADARTTLIQCVTETRL